MNAHLLVSCKTIYLKWSSYYRIHYFREPKPDTKEKDRMNGSTFFFVFFARFEPPSAT